MKIGVVYPQTELGGDPVAVGKFARAAESLGYTHLVAYDHVVGASHDREPKLWGPYTELDPFHDPFVMFAHVSGFTTTLEFMTGILIAPQRQTVLLAKQAADLDLLSGQRFRMGVGTGWNYVEYDALGQDFKTRGARLDEQIGYMRRLWSEPLLSFKGKFDAMDQGSILPRPKRRIPIWVGGFSEPAYRRGGRLGDGYIFGREFDEVKRAVGRVEHHLRESGRPLAGFGKELIVQNLHGVQPTVDRLMEWRDLGGTHASVVTMRQGYAGVDAHIDFIAAIKAKLNG
jgi:probable F420-dependent oxidoreductase